MIRLVDQLRGIRHTFSSNRARSLLTLLGIMIGAGSIVLLAGLLRGGQEALLRTSQSATDADLVQVRVDDAPLAELKKTTRALSERDANALADSRLLHGARVATESTRQVEALYRGHKKRVRLVGALPVAPALYRLQLAKGRFLDAEDLSSHRRVCVVGQEVWRELLASRPSLDDVAIVADGQEWTVVGVLADKPMLGGGGDGTWMWNRKVLVPQTTFDAIYYPGHEVQRLFIRVGGLGELAARLRSARAVVGAVLLRRHYGVHNFKVDNDDSWGNQQRMILGIIKLLLLGTGLLSLFVGGINIMNIMLVTVTERTREIGIRRAVGATPVAVLAQFLLEASAIALVGGLLGVLGGVLLSWGCALLLTHYLGSWNLHIESWSIALGLGLSLFTGVAFGLFPAWRAARLDPVEALRYE